MGFPAVIPLAKTASDRWFQHDLPRKFVVGVKQLPAWQNQVTTTVALSPTRTRGITRALRCRYSPIMIRVIPCKLTCFQRGWLFGGWELVRVLMLPMAKVRECWSGAPTYPWEMKLLGERPSFQ
jgi:hypothetical protein